MLKMSSLRRYSAPVVARPPIPRLTGSRLYLLYWNAGGCQINGAPDRIRTYTVLIKSQVPGLWATEARRFAALPFSFSTHYVPPFLYEASYISSILDILFSWESVSSPTSAYSLNLGELEFPFQFSDGHLPRDSLPMHISCCRTRCVTMLVMPLIVPRIRRYSPLT